MLPGVYTEETAQTLFFHIRVHLKKFEYRGKVISHNVKYFKPFIFNLYAYGLQLMEIRY